MPASNVTSPVYKALIGAGECAWAHDTGMQANRPQPTLDVPNPSNAEKRAQKHAQKSTLVWSGGRRGDAAVLTPMGTVDQTNADAFAQHLIASIKMAPPKLVLDLAGIGVMTSRGLRALTLAERAAHTSDTRIVLARPSAAMREVLAISGYDMFFRVADSLEDAIGG